MSLAVVGRQARQHVLQIGERLELVELCRADQADDVGRTLPRTQ